MKIGFIGLGSMGLPMAQRLLAEGHELTVYARRAATLEPLAGTTATVAATPAAMGANVDAVGICVFDAAGVDEVLFGTDGLAETLRPGSVVLVHSTVSPTEIQAIAERAAAHGLRVLDAPVSGGAPRALTGTLTIMLGGDTQALADVSEPLAALSDHVVHLGDIGAGSCAKLINNTMLAAQIALADHAVRAGESLGVDPLGLASALRTSSSACIGARIRLGTDSLAAIAATDAAAPLTKDVRLTADLLGTAPGSELVGVAQHFIDALGKGKDT